MCRATEFANRATNLILLQPSSNFSDRLIDLCNEFGATTVNYGKPELCWLVGDKQISYSYQRKFFVK